MGTRGARWKVSPSGGRVIGQMTDDFGDPVDGYDVASLIALNREAQRRVSASVAIWLQHAHQPT